MNSLVKLKCVKITFLFTLPDVCSTAFKASVLVQSLGQGHIQATAMITSGVWSHGVRVRVK